MDRLLTSTLQSGGQGGPIAATLLTGAITGWVVEWAKEIAPSARDYDRVGSARDTQAGGDAEPTFRTPPVPGTAMDPRIGVLGDAGCANGKPAAVCDACDAWTGSRTPDLCLLLGDHADTSGAPTESQAAVFDMDLAFLRKMALWSCLGNHNANNGSTSGTANFPQVDHEQHAGRSPTTR